MFLTGRRSLVLALLLVSAAGFGSQKPASRHPVIETKGPLKVHPTNKRYFSDLSGKVVYLAGAQSGGWDIQDNAWGSYMAHGVRVPANFKRHLDIVAGHGQNLIRLWVVESTRWDKGDPGAVAGPMVYARPGPGLALDGKPKFDLNRFDPEYFSRLRAAVVSARDRGVYVIVMLFEAWSSVRKTEDFATGGGANPWFGHPFNAKNNINQINGDANRDGWGTEVHSLTVPHVTELQKAYVRKVVDTVNDLDNVIYEIANETLPEGDSWQYEMIQTILDYESSKPKVHPVLMSSNGKKDNAALYKSRAHAIAPSGDSYRVDPPPVSSGAKVIIADADHINWHTHDPQYVWKHFLRGNNPLIFDWGLTPFDWNSGKPTVDEPVWEPIRNALGYTRKWAERIALADMTPQPELSSTGYCLAKVGSEYLAYQPAGGPFKMTLTSGQYSVEWFNPQTGQSALGKPVTGNGTGVDVSPPFKGSAVVHVKRRNASS